MRIDEHAGRAVRDNRPDELGDREHARFDVHVRIQQARRQVAALCLITWCFRQSYARRPAQHRQSAHRRWQYPYSPGSLRTGHTQRPLRITRSAGCGPWRRLLSASGGALDIFGYAIISALLKRNRRHGRLVMLLDQCIGRSIVIIWPCLTTSLPATTV